MWHFLPCTIPRNAQYAFNSTFSSFIWPYYWTVTTLCRSSSFSLPREYFPSLHMARSNSSWKSSWYFYRLFHKGLGLQFLHNTFWFLDFYLRTVFEIQDHKNERNFQVVSAIILCPWKQQMEFISNATILKPHKPVINRCKA